MSLPWLCGGRILTQDGPSHVYNSVVLRELIFNAQSPYHAIYQVNPLPVPNWLTYPILAGLEAAFGPVQAHNLLFSALVLISYLSFAYAVRVLSNGRHVFSPLLNAAANSWFLYMGFFNFVAGIALAVVALAYWVGHAEKARRRDYFLLGLLTLLVYFAHALPFLISVSILYVHTALNPALRSRAATLAKLSCCLAPSLLVASAYGAAVAAIVAEGTARRAGSLSDAIGPIRSRLFGATTYFSGELTLTPLLLTFGILALLDSRTHEPRFKIVLFAATALFAASFVVPSETTTNNLTGERLYWSSVLLLALTTAAHQRTLIPLLIEAAAAVLVTAGCVDYAIISKRFNVAVESYETALNRLPRGTAFVRVIDLPGSAQATGTGSLDIAPLNHFEDYAAAERRLAHLTNYEPTKIYFPVRYRADILNPNDQLYIYLLGLAPLAESLKALHKLPAAADSLVVVAGKNELPALDASLSPLRSGMQRVVTGEFFTIYSLVSPMASGSTPSP